MYARSVGGSAGLRKMPGRHNDGTPDYLVDEARSEGAW